MNNYVMQLLGQTLEREKLSEIKYRYFIADKDGNHIKDIDDKYFNCREIERYLAGYQIEEDWIGDKYFERENEIVFRYFEFDYNQLTPNSRKYYKEINDTYGQSIEEVSDFEAENFFREKEFELKKYNSILVNESNEEKIDEIKDKIEQIEFEIDEKFVIKEIGGDVITLKAIIDENGSTLVDGIKEIISLIIEANAVIVKLPFFHGCEWENEFFNLPGNEDELWAVYKLSGDLLFSPVKAKIKFESFIHPQTGEFEGVFSIDNGRDIYDINGNRKLQRD
jgi:hypothetical protein